MKPYYQDDSCTIYHGDCREILPQLPKVDLVLTDPPYGLKNWNNRGYLNDARIFNQGVKSWDAQPSAETLSNAISSGENAIVWGGNYFGLGPCVRPLIWDKENGKNRFADGEMAWTSFSEGTLRIFRHQWLGFVKASERGEDVFHPTQKPVALMLWCMGFTPDAQTILDPFMGSGTTLVAAKQIGRKAIGIEIEEKYCEIAARRLQQEYLPLITVVETPQKYSEPSFLFP